MKSGLLILFLCVTSLTLLAQPPREVVTGKITGVVQDSTTNQGVEFATVALVDQTSQKPVNGEVCDDKGQFTISKIPVGSYVVTISFIGYATKLIKVQVTDKSNDINLGNILLSPTAKTLKTVEVVGQRALIEEKVDRTIYNAENDATAKGGDATDVLRRVPMLSVDMDGNVSLRGSQNIKVLINNKPSTITASSIADALKQIPADQIKTVEVITSPSAKYDAEGSAGIINIITKKNTLEGLTMNINSSAGYRGSNLGLQGGYRKGNLGLSLGGFGRAQYNTPGNFYNDQTIYDQTSSNTSRNVQSAATRNQNIFGNYTLGLDYDIDKNNSLTGSVRFGIRDGHNYQDNLVTKSYANSLENYSIESVKNVNSINESHSVDASLNYTHLFAKPNREFNLLTLYSQSNGNNNFITQTVHTRGTDAGQGTDTLAFLRNTNPTQNSEATVQADFQTPISELQLLEVGGKEIMRKATSTSYYQAAGGDGVYQPYSGSIYNANSLDYTQNITAGYFSYTLSTRSKYSLKAGTRYEYTTISATSLGVPLSIPNYGVLVPSVNLSKRLDNGNMIKISFNRRIQRPSIQNLNPNTVASNSLNISKGNPSLSPEYTNNYELSYNTNIKNTTLNMSTFIRTTDNSIQQVRTSQSITLPDGTPATAVSTTYGNIGLQNAYGASVFANVSLSNKFTLSGGADSYYAVLKNPNPSIPAYAASNSGWVTNVRMFGNYTIGNGWGLQFFGFYRGRQVLLQGYQGAFRIYSLSLQKEFNEKRGSIGFGAENFITPTMTVNSSTVSPIVNQTGYSKFYNFNLKVTFSYRIGKLNSQPKKSKKSVNNDDLKDAGDQGGGDQQMGGGQQQGGGQRGGGMQAPASQPNLKMAVVDPTKVVNAAGTWNYTVESPQGGAGKLVIVKDGEKYSGTITSTRNNKEMPLSAVTVNGNEITITYEVSFGGNTMSFSIKGTIMEDELNGNISVGQFGTFPLNGKREKQ